MRLSSLVGEKGRVYAEDIADARLEGLRRRVTDAHLGKSGVGPRPQRFQCVFPQSVRIQATRFPFFHLMPEYTEIWLNATAFFLK